MANMLDFIAATYDMLAGLLGIAGSSPSAVMQLAWPGYPLYPSDFKRTDAPDGPYDAAVARETLSRIANIVPALSRFRFDNSGFEVDDLYEILISSAIPAGVARSALVANPMNRLFSDAQFELLQARRAVHDDPNEFYYPCAATPHDWYDEAASQLWTNITLTSANVKPLNPATSPFVSGGGLAVARKGLWTLKPTPADIGSIKSSVQREAAAKDRRLRELTPRPLGPRSGPRPLDAHRAAAMRRITGTRTPDAAAMARSPAFREHLHAARSEALFREASPPMNAFASPALVEALRRVDLTQSNLGMRPLRIAKRMAMSNLVYDCLPRRPPPTVPGGLGISFKLCRVNIRRHWLKLALLSTRNWYVFNTARGTYSTGRLDDNPGVFPLLPTSLIAIRDLKITASWSPGDRQNIHRAASFGPFNLLGATVNANTLEVRGMQIIAWISRLMPLMPPMSPR
ncbi:hypothetical protein BE04_06760 [Sorangium cellulosum]|uniref:Uncharacterized protein n=1 Tax=Sorangium cellulosum TaxID=56 RepID=A0A150PJV4_SORCE|nr:hypothetical protein BE04_06760 [Sorangium cellulosum]